MAADTAAVARSGPSKTRGRRYAAPAALAGSLLLAWAAASAYRGHRELDDRLATIEVRYAPVLALIETRAKELPRDGDPWPESLDRREAIEAELKAVLDGPEVVSAHWSLDGHHGMRNLDTRPALAGGAAVTGATTYPFWVARNASGRRTLRFGRTFEGRKLYVLEGRVPGGVNRAYRIAFLVED